MKKRTILFTFLLVSIAQNLSAQTAIDVAESTLKVAAVSEEVFYYGFAEGDQIIFNFEEVNGKELKELEIIELPTSSRYMDYKTKKIEGKILSVPKTGIYKFRFTNSALSGRICKFKIQRIPLSEATKTFNTSVYWKTVYDTTYTPTTEQFLVKSDTSVVECYNSTPQISSQNALNGNSNYQVIDFYLPENTVAWSYYLGTGNGAKVEYENAKTKYTLNAATSISRIPGYGPLAALALTGVSFFGKVQGEDNVKFWFLSDVNSVTLFQNNQPFYSYKKGDVITEASRMESPMKGKVYLALLNDNTMEVITVTIKVTAVCVKNEYESRIVQKVSIAKSEVPFLKN